MATNDHHLINKLPVFRRSIRMTVHKLLLGRTWEIIFLVILCMLVPFLALYNLDINPRPTFDEGTMLSLPKTLVEDGIYATKNSDGYQTFGAVQSVGPTLLLPVALGFKLFGVGLYQGRMINGIFTIFTIAAFFLICKEIAGRRAAILGVFLLLGSSTAGILLYGRQVLGEFTALGFYFAGLLIGAQKTSPKKGNLILSGVLFGLAMITKSQYLVMVIGPLTLLAILDLIYFKKIQFRNLALTGLIAIICLTIWQGFQFIYFGSDTYLENASKLRNLLTATQGINIKMMLSGLKYLFESESGNFYFFWGLPAIIYAFIFSIRRNQNAFLSVNLLFFMILWFGYYLLRIPPWPEALYASMSVLAIFVVKWLHDLTDGLTLSWQNMLQDIKHGKSSVDLFKLLVILMFVTMVSLSFIRTAKVFVLDTEWQLELGQPQLQAPKLLAEYLERNISKDSIIETTERELSILSNQNFHFPDSSIIGEANTQTFRGNGQDYLLTKDYFLEHRPAYLVIGGFSRLFHVYDMDFVEKNGHLIKSIGQGEWGYDIYKMNFISP